MLAKSPTSTKISYAISDHRKVRLTGGLECPHCERILRATDIDIHGEAVRMICTGCHRDMLIIGNE